MDALKPRWWEILGQKYCWYQRALPYSTESSTKQQLHCRWSWWWWSEVNNNLLTECLYGKPRPAYPGLHVHLCRALALCRVLPGPQASGRTLNSCLWPTLATWWFYHINTVKKEFHVSQILGSVVKMWGNTLIQWNTPKCQAAWQDDPALRHPLEQHQSPRCFIWTFT